MTCGGGEVESTGVVTLFDVETGGVSKSWDFGRENVRRPSLDVLQTARPHHAWYQIRGRKPSFGLFQ